MILPSRARPSSSKINIILDLDNTLINSLDKSTITEKYMEQMKQKLAKYTRHTSDYYHVYERPHLQTFLDFLFRNFNVSVWTAASRAYAAHVVESCILQNKPDRHLDYIFWSEHSQISDELSGTPKNLSLLYQEFGLEKDGYGKHNTCIIDDLDDVYNFQPKNCIHVKPFNVLDEDSNKDEELLKIQKFLERFCRHAING